MLQLKDNPFITYSSITGEQGLTSADWSQPWRVAYCKPRQEKAFATQLVRLKITYFLPMVERSSVSGGSKRRNMYVVFPSYVFFAGDEHVRVAALKTDRLVTLVDVPEAAQDQLRRELKAVEAALRVAPKSIEFQSQPARGTKLTCTNGPLAGMDGILVNGSDRQKLWLGIAAIGGGVTIDWPNGIPQHTK